MPINVSCNKCGHKWPYKGTAVKATCPSCYTKVQVRILPDPGPRKLPSALNSLPRSVLLQPEVLADKMRAEKVRGSIRHHAPKDDTCETVRGQITKTPAGNLQEDIIVSASPSSVVHGRTPFTPAQQQEGIVCDLCNRIIKAPKMGYFVDGQPLHGRCLVDRALLECCGDLQRAAKAYGLPLKALEKRVSVLKNKGKLPKESNLA